MSVKININGLENVQKRVKAAFNKIRKDEGLLLEIGNTTLDNIVNTARSGKNAETNKQFPTLSDSWRAKRDYLSLFNQADSFYLGSEKSNLTFTGALLNSMRFRINKEAGSVTVFAKGNHPGYKTKSSSTKTVSNENLIKYLANKGFVFLAVSKPLRTRINVITKRFIRKLILNKDI